jgi:hypothetical protein
MRYKDHHNELFFCTCDSEREPTATAGNDAVNKGIRIGSKNQGGNSKWQRRAEAVE